MLRVCLILLLMISSFRAHAQDRDELHLFTDKKGNQITANLLGIAEDRRTAKIRREDGMEFTPEIVLFSLDDQQYIKDWMEAEAKLAASETPVPEFHLTLKVDHKEESTEKHSQRSLTLESTPHYFEISVLNTSRETLEGAVLEYAVVWQEDVAIFEDEDEGEWDYSYTRRDDIGMLVRKNGSLPLETLAFNRDVKLESDKTPIERVVDSYGDPVREDLLLGALVRVVGADGQVLAEATSGKSELSAYTWEKTLTIASSEVEED
ncbi:MAG: hypothetical protein P1U86_09130 [Verrucomicrobiales bacterium]|nr:hypothetical protein [Verrucomicrobiales bacterium]